MRGNKLIIITEYSSLKTVDDRVKNLQGFNNLKNNGFLKFGGNRLIEISTLDDTEIVFIWDRAEEGYAKAEKWWKDTFLPLQKNEKWYIVYHSKGIQPEETDSMICKQGTHVPNDHVYGKVVSILLDSDSNKKERIITDVFTLKAILAFLHGCLDKKPEKADLKKFEEETGISVSQSELKGELYNEEYFNSLSTLRDKLLNGGDGKSDNCR
ncbi:MAG: hypothetical protein LBS55_07355 [Prevotellaceae bacterium]|jgi:hypothetical protein|nr:hypothetical protein [Prevotellaceae bacterium]